VALTCGEESSVADRDGETGTHEVFHHTSNRTVVHNLHVIARQPTPGDYQPAA
jgi:hypothetical protein